MARVRELVLAIAVFPALAAPVAMAGTPMSRARFWTNRPRTADCGVRITSKPFQLLCSASGIPRPKNGGRVGDPFVVLGRTGRPELVLISQDEFPGGNPKVIANGATWSNGGVTCAVARKVRCTNRSGHGFTIGNGRYKAF